MHYLSYFFSKNNHVVHTIIWSRGVIIAVQSVWSAIFPLNQNFRFDQIWHRHQTNWISIDSVRPTFDFFQFLRNQTDQREKKEPISLCFSTFSQQPNTKHQKKKLKIMYIFRDHTKIRKYIFPFAFPRFLTTQTPSTKQSSKHTPKKKRTPKKRISEEVY